MKRRCFAFLMAFLFVSALIVAAEPSGLEPENAPCNVEEIIEEPAVISEIDEAVALFSSDAEQAEAVLTEPSDSWISIEEISPFDVLGKNIEDVTDAAEAGLLWELDEEILDSSLEGENPADLLIAAEEVSVEQAIDEDSEAVFQHPSDVLSVSDLKVRSSLDPIRLVRLPDGCRVEGDILLTVVIQNMSSQSLRVKAMPIFGEQAQALYRELGISLDQDAVELVLDGGEEKSLLWLFISIAGKVADLDPSLINAQDLGFQLRVTVEADI